MRFATCFFTWACLSGPVPAGDALKVNFKKEDAGKLPAAWKAAQTGQGEGSVWKVVADQTAPAKTGFVLAQTAAGPGPLFNLCILDFVKAKDVEISVHFKAVKGELDQGGGIVWRYQDPNNYYMARMNPLEDNYRLYKVVNGKRIQLASAGKIKVPVGTWHQLSIKHAGKKIECRLDGKKFLEAEDDSIAGKGQTGLWTKADAQTSFDQFMVRVLSEKQKQRP